MNRMPEPTFHPPESLPSPLRCCLCLRQVPEALELPYGNVCRTCLDRQTIEELSALLCAAIITDQGGN